VQRHGIGHQRADAVVAVVLSGGTCASEARPTARRPADSGLAWSSQILATVHSMRWLGVRHHSLTKKDADKGHGSAPGRVAGLGLPTEHRMPSSEPLALSPHQTGAAEQIGGSASVLP